MESRWTYGSEYEEDGEEEQSELKDTIKNVSIASFGNHNQRGGSAIPSTLPEKSSSEKDKIVKAAPGGRFKSNPQIEELKNIDAHFGESQSRIETHSNN